MGEAHFIFKTGSIYQDEVSILKIYIPNTRKHTYVKEILLKLNLQINPAHNNCRRLQQSSQQW